MTNRNDLELVDVSKRFGEFIAVANLNLRISAGEFFSFLGPSGCGKTTILRMVSGFTDPTEGEIRLAGQDLRGIGPNRRPTALIFQNLALFPLMTVAENIAFGLEMRGVRTADRRRRVDQLLALIALEGYADKHVTDLSGGQRQRVAIARALAVEPKVLLLDEPLSALDLKLRQHMRAELRAIQQRTGITFIYITHDQGEALAMSDRVAVMSQAVVEQVGSPAEIYNTPRTSFVASFVGESNLFTGKVREVAEGLAVLDTSIGLLRGVDCSGVRVGDEAHLFVRPECMQPANGHDLGNIIEADVTGQVFEGATVNVRLRSPIGCELMVSLPNDGSAPLWQPGTSQRVGFACSQAIVLAKGRLARD